MKRISKIAVFLGIVAAAVLQPELALATDAHPPRIWEMSDLATELAAKQAHEREILDCPGVLGVGIGLRNDRPALVVLVDDSFSTKSLPKSFDGVPVAVERSEGIRLINGGGECRDEGCHADKQALPVMMGNSTSNNVSCNAGTLGFKACHLGTSAIGYVTCNHVAATQSNGCENLGGAVAQIHPGTWENPNCSSSGSDVIGLLQEVIPIVPGDNPVDAAFVVSEPNRTSPWIRDIGFPNVVERAPALGLCVAKSGRTTGLTFGTIDTVSFTWDGSGKYCTTGASILETFRFVPAQGAGCAPCTVSDCIQAAKGGDSGSAVVDANNNLVGMVFANETRGKLDPTTPVLAGWAMPAGAILSELDLSLDLSLCLHPPVGVPDQVTVPAGIPSVFIPGDLMLANDWDPDGDPMTICGYRDLTQYGTLDASQGPIGATYYPDPEFFTAGQDRFQYLLTDTDSPGCTVVYKVDVYLNADSTGQQTMAEAGQVADLSHVSQTVILNHTFADPVVFAQPPSTNGAQTAVVRITDVQPDRFTFYVHEAPNWDGSHMPEVVSYLVAERGRWQLADGTKLEVDRLDTDAQVGLVSSSWAMIEFHNITTAPVVISQVQSYHNPAWIKTREHNAFVGGVKLALEAEEASITAHGVESLGWMVFDTAQGSWSNQLFEAARTPPAVTHQWYPLTFAQAYTEAPIFIAGLTTYNGSDPAALRYRNLTASGLEVRVEEDTTLTSETNHAAEVVSYLAIQQGGLLSALRLP